jgi:hypothetical protein
MRSPTTTSPVAIPTRICNVAEGYGVFDAESFVKALLKAVKV